MVDDISLGSKQIPCIPEGIIDAINRKRFIVFVGAGVSQLFNLPSWGALAKKMVEFAFNDQSSGNRVISFSAKKQLLSRTYDPRKLLSIVYEMYRNNVEIFLNEMCSLLNKKPNKKNPGERIIQVLIKWNVPIITTNYDTIIEELSNNNYRSFKSCREFNVSEFNNPPFVLHLHGSVNKPGDMIFSVTQYHALYHNSNDVQGAQNILKHLFNSDYVILFIGYSLNDNELVEYLQNSNRSNSFFYSTTVHFAGF